MLCLNRMLDITLSGMGMIPSQMMGVKELEVEQTMADMLYFTDHEGKLRIDNYYIAN